MKKFFYIKIRRKDGYAWYTPIECQMSSRSFIDGYISCLQAHYPSPDIQLYEINGKEHTLVKEIKGRCEVGINSKNKIDVDINDKKSICLNWSTESNNFGNIVFKYKDKELVCDSEAMSKDFVKEVLVSLLEKSRLLDE